MIDAENVVRDEHDLFAYRLLVVVAHAYGGYGASGGSNLMRSGKYRYTKPRRNGEKYYPKSK